MMHVVRPTTPPAEADGLGFFLFARHYSGNRGFFLFHQVLRCVSSLGWLGDPGIIACLTASPGFSQPSTPFRLLAPRHPPHALSSLTTMILGCDVSSQQADPIHPCRQPPHQRFATRAFGRHSGCLFQQPSPNYIKTTDTGGTA